MVRELMFAVYQSGGVLLGIVDTLEEAKTCLNQSLCVVGWIISQGKIIEKKGF